MRTKVHLVSLPWANWRVPSIQTGCLKAYLDRELGEQVTTQAYSAAFSILFDAFGTRYDQAFEKHHLGGEYLYFFLYLERFLRKRDPAIQVDLAELMQKFNALAENPVSMTTLRALGQATRRFVDETLVPSFDPQACNVVGFSLQYEQTFAALYCMDYLREKHPDPRRLFVLGGTSANTPRVVSLFRRLSQDAFSIMGEGESKLTQMITLMLAAPADTCDWRPILNGKIPGLYHFEESFEWNDRESEYLKTEFPSLDGLPMPNYEEFLATTREACADEEAWFEFKKHLWLLVEGSRGCFSHCDFCGLNASWASFRKFTPERVLHTARELTAQYRIPRIEFVDNVCDTWAEKFADALITDRAQLPSFMELRAHHPEKFWTKLSLSGVTRIQIGVEALSDPLLGAIGKGTKVIQNLRVQKWLAELGVISASNLITSHPRSTRADADETWRIVQEIPHFGYLTISNFRLSVGSPLYERLPEATRRAVPGFIPIPLHPSVDSYLIGWGTDLQSVGDLVLAAPVQTAWNQFREKYERLWDSFARVTPKFTTERVISGETRIEDHRDGTVKEYWLSGNIARVFDECHQGISRPLIVARVGTSGEEVAEALRWLLERKLVIKVGIDYLSLPLRPKQVLLQNLMMGDRTDALPQVRSSAAPKREPESVSLGH